MNPGVVIGLVGAGLLLLFMGEESQVEEPNEESELEPEPAPKKSEPEAKPSAAKRDPLPDFDLNQANIVTSILEYIEHEWPEKMQSMLIKAHLQDSDEFRAYIIACLKRFPILLREEKLFLNVEDKIHKKDRDERADIIKEGRDREAKVEAALNVVPVVGPIISVAMNFAFGEFWDWLEKDSKGRVAEDQILNTYEGVGLIKGIAFDAGPEVPNLNRADQIKRQEIRNRWFVEKDSDVLFAKLPKVPNKQAFRFAPTYSDFVSAVESIRSAR